MADDAPEHLKTSLCFLGQNIIVPLFVLSALLHSIDAPHYLKKTNGRILRRLWSTGNEALGLELPKTRTIFGSMQ